MDRVSGAYRVARDCLLEREPLLRHPSAGGLAIARLPGERGLNSVPRIQGNHRPIAPESLAPAALRDRLPRPGAWLAVVSGIFQPDIERVRIGIRVQRLEAGDHA